MFSNTRYLRFVLFFVYSSDTAVFIFMYRGWRVFVQNIYLISINDTVSHGATQTLALTTDDTETCIPFRRGQKRHRSHVAVEWVNQSYEINLDVS